jgi:ribosomal protein L28
MGRLWVRRGVLTGKEIIANNERILSSKSYEGVRWLLIDDTETTMDISAAEIRTIKQQDDRIAAVLPELERF